MERAKNRDVVLGRTLAETAELNSPEHLAGAEARAAVHRAGCRKGRPEPAPFPHRGADSVPGSGVDRRPRLADGAGHPGFVTAVQSDHVQQRSSVAAWRGWVKEEFRAISKRCKVGPRYEPHLPSKDVRLTNFSAYQLARAVDCLRTAFASGVDGAYFSVVQMASLSHCLACGHDCRQAGCSDERH